MLRSARQCFDPGKAPFVNYIHSFLRTEGTVLRHFRQCIETFLIFRRGEERPGGSGRWSHRKQHGRPQRADQNADAQRYDDAELVVPRLFGDHCLGVLRNRRAVHREELSESEESLSVSVRVVKRGHGLKDGGEFMTKR